MQRAGADAGLMALFYDALRCGAVVRTSAAHAYDNAMAKVGVDTASRATNATDDKRESLARYTVAVSFGSHAGSGTVPAWSVPASVPASDQGALHKGVCSISPQDAINIFLSKHDKRGARDRLAVRLAEAHGITSRAVRDIWNLRTWSRTTKPYWSSLDAAHVARTGLNRATRSARPASPAPATTVEVAVEPTLSKDVAPASDVADGYNVNHVMQEDLMMTDVYEMHTRGKTAQASPRELVCNKGNYQIVSIVPTDACSECPPDLTCGDHTVDNVELPSGNTPGVEDDPQNAAKQTRAQPMTAGDLPALATRAMPKQAVSPSQLLACEWRIDPAIIAQEFEEIFVAWQCSSARRDCVI
jgi:hypothetical protein